MGEPKLFLNSPGTLVVEAIEGTLACEQHLAAMQQVKVVLDARRDPGKVAVVSGGGSGHEPAMVGYVGEGMLAAAVCGEVFASPSEDAVLAAIRAVTGPAGCLVIVMNYTGDRLNFGQAAERAKAENLKVEVVVVADDCALDYETAAHRHVGRRGIAGTVLVHKVAGALAAQGAPLERVKAAAERAASLVGTMGCSMTVCNMPGKPLSDRLGPGEMEMGLGIHGEPGAYKSAVKPADQIVHELLGRVTAPQHLPVQPGERVALLVNNLGATTQLELNLAAKEAVGYVCDTLKARLERVWVGTFMTSLDMHGLSLTLMRVDDALLPLLDAPAKVPAWPALPGAFHPPKQPTPLPTGPTDEVPVSDTALAVSQSGELVQQCIKAACEAVLSAHDELNALDAKVGDGDCGSTIAKGASSVLESLDKLPADDLPATVQALAHLVGRSMGGTSGAVYRILLTAAAAALKGQQEAGASSAAALGAALGAGAAAVSKYGGAAAGSRTMLDALLPAAAAIQEGAASGASTASVAQSAAAAAHEGAEATKSMTAHAGRSSYVPEAVQHSVPDPGAVAVARWMAGAANALQQ